MAGRCLGKVGKDSQESAGDSGDSSQEAEAEISCPPVRGLGGHCLRPAQPFQGVVPQTGGWEGSVGIFHLWIQEKVSQIRLRIFGGSIATRVISPLLKGTEVQGKTLHSLQWSVPSDQKKGVFGVMDECPREGNTDQVNGV